MITRSSILFSKATITSAIIHLGVIGGIGNIAVLNFDKKQTVEYTPISIHFTSPSSYQRTPPKKNIVKKIIKHIKPLKKISSKKAMPAKLSSKEPPFSPVEISTISCAGAYMPQPSYPKYALRKKLNGLVKVHLNLDSKGFVDSVYILKSSNHKILDQAALTAIKRWSFPKHIAEKTPSIIVPIRFVIG